MQATIYPVKWHHTYTSLGSRGVDRHTAKDERMTTKCQAITKNGTPCTVPPLTGGQHCLHHAPGSIELKRKGGRNGSTANRARRLFATPLTDDELVGLLSKLLQDVMRGTTEPKVGTAAATIARALLEARRAIAQPSIEDLQAQVAEVRALIEQRRREHAA